MNAQGERVITFVPQTTIGAAFTSAFIARPLIAWMDFARDELTQVRNYVFSQGSRAKSNPCLRGGNGPPFCFGSLILLVNLPQSAEYLGATTQAHKHEVPCE